ncbi:MAG: DUF7509 family protein [Halobacteriota archaeon]
MRSLDTYQGEPIRDIIERSLPYCDDANTFVFVMGPYRLLDPSYLYPGERDTELPPDPLAPRSHHDPDLIEATLREVCKELTEKTGVAAFIASDVEIPTKTQVEQNELDESGMAVLDQSVAFAAASEGNAFVFTKAGLTTGVGSEAGAIPEYFRLRYPDDRPRSPKTFCIFEEATYDAETNRYHPKFSSASIDEMDITYDIQFRYFNAKHDLVEAMTSFVESYVIPSTL